MAETIRQSIDFCDAIGNEHVDFGNLSDAAGARKIADSIDVDFDEMKDELVKTREIVSLHSQKDSIVAIDAPELGKLFYAMLVSGFLYGARWRGENP